MLIVMTISIFYGSKSWSDILETLLHSLPIHSLHLVADLSFYFYLGCKAFAWTYEQSSAYHFWSLHYLFECFWAWGELSAEEGGAGVGDKDDTLKDEMQWPWFWVGKGIVYISLITTYLSDSILSLKCFYQWFMAPNGGKFLNLYGSMTDSLIAAELMCGAKFFCC